MLVYDSLFQVKPGRIAQLSRVYVQVCSGIIKSRDQNPCVRTTVLEAQMINMVFFFYFDLGLQDS
jgi:hypothetical protein